ncbi:hypothetical protein AN392_00066 [Pseudoalteromonas sp. P1-16-1b]|uniref:hypothetical protein n=1 Tax=Pseudoalteromonas sp. P1-16-1b TaxID=1723757 RepID=UPI0006D67767|nr:hypothetical protein [Pseudoalteromonas sp. P1-16-1b]KPZ66627.1 hypothetical protein AN392_00066 [Pseudoalteromonas sp. P1-16-1b]
MALINIGLVYEPCPNEIKSLESIIVSITNTAPEKEKIVGLDGPNEIVQLIFEAANWQNILAIFLGSSFLKSFGSELGKQAASALIKKTISEDSEKPEASDEASGGVNDMLEVIKKLQEKGQMVTFSVKIEGSPRNASILIGNPSDRQEIYKICMVALYAEEIQEYLTEMIASDRRKFLSFWEPPTFSMPIEVLENGSIIVAGKVFGDEI